MIRFIVVAAAALALAGCATNPPPAVTQVQTQEVAVTHTERAVTPAQVQANVPPPALGPRPSTLQAIADLALAKVCEWVSWGMKSDLMNQHAAGMSPVQRIHEPVCEAAPATPQPNTITPSR